MTNPATPAPPLSGIDLDRAVEERIFGKPCTSPFPPPHAVSIAAAWRVVEHLRGQGWGFILQDIGPGPDWYACFYRPGCRVAQGGATAPEAICRAALSVVADWTDAQQEQNPVTPSRRAAVAQAKGEDETR